MLCLCRIRVSCCLLLPQRPQPDVYVTRSPAVSVTLIRGSSLQNWPPRWCRRPCGTLVPAVLARVVSSSLNLSENALLIETQCFPWSLWPSRSPSCPLSFALRLDILKGLQLLLRRCSWLGLPGRKSRHNQDEHVLIDSGPGYPPTRMLGFAGPH